MHNTSPARAIFASFRARGPVPIGFPNPPVPESPKSKSEGGETDLVPPEEPIACAVLEAVPDVEQLLDAVFADVVGVLFRFGPGQRRSEREQTHLVRSGSGRADVGLWADARGVRAAGTTTQALKKGAGGARARDPATRAAQSEIGASLGKAFFSARGG